MLRSFYVAIFQSKRAGCLLESISIPKIHIAFRKGRNSLSNKSTRFIITVSVFNGNPWKSRNCISKNQLSNALHNIRSQSWLRTCCSRYPCLIEYAHSVQLRLQSIIQWLYAIELLPWKYDWPARIKSFSKTPCCFPLVLCMFCLFHVFILLKCWHLAENMLLFPKVPLILWIGSKLSTKCGRVHFEHSHRKWLVITVSPTTSVRENPRKNLPPRNTPDLFCRRFTRQNPSLRCMGGIFLFHK